MEGWDQARVWLLAGGVACIALGAYLIAEPFSSVTALVALTAASLLASGASELAASRTAARPWPARVAGSIWIATGIAAIVWPAIALSALAVLAGGALLAGGLAKVLALTGDGAEDRVLLTMSAVANALLGLLALAWPSATVLVLALLFGIRTAVFGATQVLVALDGGGTRFASLPAGARPTAPPRWTRPLRWSLTVGALALALAGMGVSIAVNRSSPPRPGPFYAAPDPLPPGPSGTIIRQEPIANYYQGAKAYRVLYKSTGFDGRPAAVSGVIVVPEGVAPRRGRNVIAFAHGTVGVANNCAPSLQRGEPGQVIEGLGTFLAAGYVVAATDYSGLGTAGTHPYLVGRVEAMNTLDAVRAAHRLRQAHASARFAVWGHSQGGHAALFTGQLAPSYAPGLHLVGVAAGAPVPSLVDLFKVNAKTTVGKVLIAMALGSWERLYDDAKLDQIVTPTARAAVAEIAGYCLYGRGLIGTVPSALLLRASFIKSPPWETEPWRRIAQENTPGAMPISVPILITQGQADRIVPAPVTERFVRELCRKGETVDLHVYPGVEHIEAGIVVVPDVATWIAARFAGRPAPSTCH